METSGSSCERFLNVVHKWKAQRSEDEAMVGAAGNQPVLSRCYSSVQRLEQRYSSVQCPQKMCREDIALLGACSADSGVGCQSANEHADLVLPLLAHECPVESRALGCNTIVTHTFMKWVYEREGLARVSAGWGQCSFPNVAFMVDSWSYIFFIYSSVQCSECEERACSQTQLGGCASMVHTGVVGSVVWDSRKLQSRKLQSRVTDLAAASSLCTANDQPCASTPACVSMDATLCDCRAPGQATTHQWISVMVGALCHWGASGRTPTQQWISVMAGALCDCSAPGQKTTHPRSTHARSHSPVSRYLCAALASRPFDPAACHGRGRPPHSVCSAVDGPSAYQEQVEETMSVHW